MTVFRGRQGEKTLAAVRHDVCTHDVLAKTCMLSASLSPYMEYTVSLDSLDHAVNGLDRQFVKSSSIRELSYFETSENILLMIEMTATWNL